MGAGDKHSAEGLFPLQDGKALEIFEGIYRDHANRRGIRGACSTATPRQNSGISFFHTNSGSPLAGMTVRQKIERDGPYPTLPGVTTAFPFPPQWNAYCGGHILQQGSQAVHQTHVLNAVTGPPPGPPFERSPRLYGQYPGGRAAEFIALSPESRGQPVSPHSELDSRTTHPHNASNIPLQSLPPLMATVPDTSNPLYDSPTGFARLHDHQVDEGWGRNYLDGEAPEGKAALRADPIDSKDLENIQPTSKGWLEADDLLPSEFATDMWQSIPYCMDTGASMESCDEPLGKRLKSFHDQGDRSMYVYQGAQSTVPDSPNSASDTLPDSQDFSFELQEILDLAELGALEEDPSLLGAGHTESRTDGHLLRI